MRISDWSSDVCSSDLSFGTEVTLWTLMKSDLLTAASVTSPGMAFNYYLLGSMKGDQFFSGLKKLWQLGAPDETPERWKMFSPTLNLDRIKAPILMQMPEQEYIHALDYTIDRKSVGQGKSV